MLRETLQKLVGEQVHQQPVVPAAVGGALIAAQDADRLEPELRVRPDRALVVGGGVDRQTVVAVLLDQVGDHQPERLGAEPCPWCAVARLMSSAACLYSSGSS